MRQSRDIESLHTNSVYELNFPGFPCRLLFPVRVNGNVAVFDIFIPRLMEDPFEISFMHVDIRHCSRINDCSKSLSRAS